MLVTPLEKIIKRFQDTKRLDDLRLLVKRFECSRDLDVQAFLRDRAIDYDLCYRAKTYFLFKDDSTEVVAYFSLAMSGVTFSENVPDKIKRKLMYGMTNKKYAPAYLIAQIGKDDAYADEKIGEYLLTAAMEAIQNARNYIGGRFVYVECKPTLRAYYEKLGFTYLQTAQNNLLQMFQVL